MKTDGYIFVTQNQSNIALNAVAPTLRDEEVTLEIGNVDVLVDDVVHMRYKENGIPKGLYGVVIFEDMDGITPSFVFKFDSNIYELYSNISQGDFLGVDIYRGIQYEKVSTYNISTDVTRANYSEELKANGGVSPYKEAVNIITNKYKNVAFFVFSDDISWTKKNLKLENTTYVEHKTIPHEDMYLMSLCSHNITANSSFSWWGAWLNRHKNKTIIAPKKWFVHKQNEVACKSWIKI